MIADDGDRGPPDDDDALWRAATRDATPLPGAAPVTPPVRRFAISRFMRQREKPDVSLSAPPARDGDLPGLDRRTDDRLRRGELPIDGRLDLHGMTQDRALAALEEFIRRCYGEGRRCVLVITGLGALRGSVEEDGNWYEPQPGILRQRVPEWLRGGPLSGMVLRAYPAQPQHGGQGAFYVLLRRRR